MLVTAGVTWSDRSKPLSSIDFTPEMAISWLNRIVPSEGGGLVPLKFAGICVRRDHIAGDIGRFQVGTDELDRVDVVIEHTIVGRGVGDDHLARPVDRDDPLVAGPIGAA